MSFKKPQTDLGVTWKRTLHTSYSNFFGLTEYIHYAIKDWWDSLYLFADIYAIYDKMQRVVWLAHDPHSVANVF